MDAETQRLAKKQIAEFEKIEKTDFWENYIKSIDDEYLKVISQLATQETAPEKQELTQYLVRLQGVLKGIRRVGRLHKVIIDNLKKKAGE